MHLYHGRYIRETNDFGNWFTKKVPYKIFAFTKKQLRCTYVMGATYEEPMVLESKFWFTKEMRYKIFVFTEKQLRCTYVMSATCEKLMILESNLLRGDKWMTSLTFFEILDPPHPPLKKVTQKSLILKPRKSDIRSTPSNSQ